MERYANIVGDSGITEYESGNDYIRVKFANGAIYKYTYNIAGVENVEKMKELATKGEGLNSFINSNVRYRYTREEKMVMVPQDEAEVEGSDTSSENETSNSDTPYKIRVETKNTTMDVLIRRIRHNEIELAPDFQRSSDIWTPKTKSRLIESMFLRIPIPAFYIDATDDNKWIIVDGLQRLTTVKQYVVEQSLSLTDLEFLTEYNGFNFDKLPRNFQRRIEETDVVVYQIQPGTPERVKFDIFRRINTGGVPLSPQEIRHALNQGKAAISLKNMAESEQFLSATDGGVSSKRMNDRECVLRFYAFRLNDPKHYKEKSFDRFLNEVMKMCNDMTDSEIERLESEFLKTMELSYALFGNLAFRKITSFYSGRSPVNKALFEAWSVNLCELDVAERDQLIQRKDKLLERFMNIIETDAVFLDSISQATGTISKVKMRFSVIRDIINEVLS